MLNIKKNEIEKVMKEKGYKFFSGGSYDVNIIGIRSEDIAENTFCDQLHLLFQNSALKWVHSAYKITTVAGLSGLIKPINSRGTAILVEGQYRGSHKIRKHKGQYDALCQKGALKVFRDNNKDDSHDFDPETIQEGYFGINIHRSNPRRESTIVNNWSLGCQVFANPDEFDQFMDVMYMARKKWGNSFSYTLLNEKDFT